VGQPFDRRKYPRLFNSFKVAITRTGQPSKTEAVTYDIAQGGSLILTRHWHTFAVGETAELRFFLPRDFTGQAATVSLGGPGVVKRLEAERNAVAVEFRRSLRTFDPRWEAEE
jgi:hypothetical protein